MSATVQKPIRTTLFDMNQLEGPNLLGKEGLQKLIAAIRSMVAWVLAPFRTVSRVLFGLGAPAAGQPSDVLTAGDVTSVPGAAKFPSGLEDGGTADQLLANSAPELQGLDDGGVADKMAARGAGTIDIELQGPPEEIDVLLPMLQRHVEQLLKAHLPADAEAVKVEGRVAALAETAEFVRYAHHIVSRQVDSMVRALAENKLYDGMSEQTILELVRASGEAGTRANGEGSDEQRLLARLALREKLAVDYAQQVEQLAMVMVRPVSTVSEEHVWAAEMATGELEAIALKAGDQSRAKLLKRGTVMQSSLEELPKALTRAIEVAKAAVAAPVAEVVGEAHAVKAPPVEARVVDMLAADVPAMEAKVVGDEGAAAEPGIVAPDPAPAPAVAVAVATPATPAKVAVPAPKAAPVATKPGGMFGATQVQRSAQEMDDVNVVDDDMPDMEGMVSG